MSPAVAVSIRIRKLMRKLNLKTGGVYEFGDKDQISNERD
jgi:hypothetical protein